MLILVPWKPFVFGWFLLTAMILAGYAVYCIQESRNPFSVEKYHLQRGRVHQSANFGNPERKRGAIAIRGARHFRAAGVADIAGELGVAFTTAQHAIERLEGIGIVKPTSGAKRDRVYCAQALLEILEEPAGLTGIPAI